MNASIGMPVRVGELAPDFRAPASTGQTLDLSAFADRVCVVLYFLGGLREQPEQQLLAGFNERLVDFGHLRVQALGVAHARASEIREFAEGARVFAPILADADASIAQSYGVQGASPATFVIDKEHRVTSIIPVGSPREHASEVLAALRDMPDA